MSTEGSKKPDFIDLDLSLDELEIDRPTVQPPVDPEAFARQAMAQPGRGAREQSQVSPMPKAPASSQRSSNLLSMANAQVPTHPPAAAAGRNPSGTKENWQDLEKIFEGLDDEDLPEEFRQHRSSQALRASQPAPPSPADLLSFEPEPITATDSNGRTTHRPSEGEAPAVDPLDDPFADLPVPSVRPAALEGARPVQVAPAPRVPSAAPASPRVVARPVPRDDDAPPPSNRRPTPPVPPPTGRSGLSRSIPANKQRATPAVGVSKSAAGAPADKAAGGSGDRIKEMRDCLSLGDYSGALALAETLLEENPDLAEARECADNCRNVLEQMYAARLGRLDRVPVVVVPREQLRWLSIDHKAGFLLSHIDGLSSLEMILDVSGMPRLHAMRILCELAQQRIISFR